MEYRGMPFSWVDFYEIAFKAVSDDFKLDLSQADIEKSCEILKGKNARVVYREIEYSPEEIFNAVTAHWKKKHDVNALLVSFFKGIRLEATIYDDTLECLKLLKNKEYKLAALTDLPTAMPDELFKKDIHGLLEHFDLYVSSLVCGYRKPNKHGLVYIAEHFGIDPEELVFIGDEEKDIKTAMNANCKSVLITRNNASPTDFGQAFSVNSLKQLTEILFH